MNRNIFLLTLLALFAVPCIGGAEVSELNMSFGENIALDCGTTNVSYDINCLGICESSCTVDASINPGTTYGYVQGLCDIDVECISCSETAVEEETVAFPGMISMDKQEGIINLTVEVDDYMGSNHFSKNWIMDYDEMYTVQYPFDIGCPAELHPDINLESCLPFLSDVLNRDNGSVTSLSLMLNHKCQEELTKCNSELLRYDDIADDKIEDWRKCFDDWEREHNDLLACRRELNLNVSTSLLGRCEFDKNRLERTMVPVGQYNTVLAWLIILAIILFIVFAAAVFGGVGL